MERSEANEEELIRRAARGDRIAGSTLVRRHEKSLWLLLFRWTGSRERTEELFQEVWLRVWPGLSRFRGEASFSTFLFKIARNLSFARRRRGHETAEPAVEPAGSVEEPVASLVRDEELQQVEQLLGRLAPRPREALVLHYLHGLAYREAAEVMGVGEATARKYAREGLQWVSRLAARRESS